MSSRQTEHKNIYLSARQIENKNFYFSIRQKDQIALRWADLINILNILGAFSGRRKSPDNFFHKIAIFRGKQALRRKIYAISLLEGEVKVSDNYHITYRDQNCLINSKSPGIIAPCSQGLMRSGGGVLCAGLR